MRCAQFGLRNGLRCRYNPQPESRLVAQCHSQSGRVISDGLSTQQSYLLEQPWQKRLLSTARSRVDWTGSPSIWPLSIGQKYHIKTPLRFAFQRQLSKKPQNTKKDKSVKKERPFSLVGYIERIARERAGEDPGQLEYSDTFLRHLPGRLSLAMRNVAHPIAIVTATNPEDNSCRGLLVSSFNTVTLLPHPYVSFNVKVPSSTLDNILDTKGFVVHLVWDKSVAEQFMGSSTALDENGAPKATADILRELDAGSLFSITCVPHSLTDIGDHIIVVGKVVDIKEAEANNAQDEQVSESRSALIWQRGAWHVARPHSEGKES